jgi:hypothetical protein
MRRQWIVTFAAAAVLLGCAVARQVSGTLELRRAKRTMHDMRIVAAAFEAHAVTAKSYPAPHVLRGVPAHDAWGNRFLIVSGGEEYRIVSAGTDGEVEEPVAEWLRSPLFPAGAVESIAGQKTYPALQTLVDEQSSGASYPALPNLGARDLVFGNGTFIRSPELSSIGDVPFPPSPAVKLVTRWVAAAAVVTICVHLALLLRTWRWNRNPDRG